MKTNAKERKSIKKKLNEVLERMPIDDLRDNTNIIIKHPYMRMVIAKNESVIFHFDNVTMDINNNLLKIGDKK